MTRPGPDRVGPGPSPLRGDMSAIDLALTNPAPVRFSLRVAVVRLSAVAAPLLAIAAALHAL